MLFVADGGSDILPTCIYRLNMAGGKERTRCIVQDKLYWPAGLAVDAPARRIYWSDSKMQTISSCEYDGTNRRIVAHLGTYRPQQIAVLGDFVFGSVLPTHGVFRVPKKGHLLPSAFDSPESRVVDGARMEPHWLLTQQISTSPFALLNNVPTHAWNLSRMTAPVCHACQQHNIDSLCLADLALIGGRRCMKTKEGRVVGFDDCSSVTCDHDQLCVDGQCMCVEDGHVKGPAPCDAPAVAVSDKNASLNAAVGVAISIVAVIGLLTAVVLYRKRKKSIG